MGRWRLGRRLPVIGRWRAMRRRVGGGDSRRSSAKGRAQAFATSGRGCRAIKLPHVETGHPLTDALALILPFNGFVESWSRACGFNPDQPVAR